MKRGRPLPMVPVKWVVVAFLPALALWVAALVVDLLEQWHVHDEVIRPIGVAVGVGYAFLVPASIFWLLSHRRRKRRRVAAGLCPECGYDLRASTDRCPECGRLIETGG